jgi:polyferredoxin
MCSWPVLSTFFSKNSALLWKKKYKYKYKKLYHCAKTDPEAQPGRVGTIFFYEIRGSGGLIRRKSYYVYFPFG